MVCIMSGTMRPDLSRFSKYLFSKNLYSIIKCMKQEVLYAYL